MIGLMMLEMSLYSYAQRKSIAEVQGLAFPHSCTDDDFCFIVEDTFC
jgi:hypothetical protein